MDKLRAVSNLAIRPAIELVSKRSALTEFGGAVLFAICMICLVIGILCLG